MKHYLKIFLLSVGISIFSFLVYQILSSIKIVINNSVETFIIYLMAAGFPIQFVVLTGVSLISKKNQKVIMITAGLFAVFWLWFHWIASIDERRSYDIAEKSNSISDNKIEISNTKNDSLELQKLVRDLYKWNETKSSKMDFDVLQKEKNDSIYANIDLNSHKLRLEELKKPIFFPINSLIIITKLQ